MSVFLSKIENYEYPILNKDHYDIIVTDRPVLVI